MDASCQTSGQAPQIAKTENLPTKQRKTATFSKTVQVSDEMLGINKIPQNNNKPINSSNSDDVIDGLTSDVDRPRSMQDDVIRLAQELQRRQVSAEVSSSVGSDVSRTCHSDLLKLKKMEEFCKVRVALFTVCDVITGRSNSLFFLRR